MGIHTDTEEIPIPRHRSPEPRNPRTPIRIIGIGIAILLLVCAVVLLGKLLAPQAFAKGVDAPQPTTSPAAPQPAPASSPVPSPPPPPVEQAADDIGRSSAPPCGRCDDRTPRTQPQTPAERPAPVSEEVTPDALPPPVQDDSPPPADDPVDVPGEGSDGTPDEPIVDVPIVDLPIDVPPSTVEPLPSDETTGATESDD